MKGRSALYTFYAFRMLTDRPIIFLGIFDISYCSSIISTIGTVFSTPILVV